MYRRGPRLFIQDMLTAITKVEKGIEGQTFETFARLPPLELDGIVHNIEIMGEAAKAIPAEIKDAFPDVPWRKMTVFRNFAVHQYFGVDPEVVWTIAAERLPEVKPHLQRIMDILSNKEEKP